MRRGEADHHGGQRHFFHSRSGFGQGVGNGRGGNRPSPSAKQLPEAAAMVDAYRKDDLSPFKVFPAQA